MISEAYIRTLVEEKLAEMPYFLVHLSVSTSNQIRVEIDGKGVKIDDCVKISRHIEGSLDREQEDFELHVSSAGMDQAFRVDQQYEKNVGRQVKVVLNDGSKLQGLLKAFRGDELDLELQYRERIEGKKKKQLVTEVKTLPLTTIKETKVVISFK